jgi:predicted RNase H-like HicB family nuclease
MDKGGWVLRVMGREVWIEVEPQSDNLIVSCPELPSRVAVVSSLDEAVLRMEELIARRAEEADLRRD